MDLDASVDGVCAVEDVDVIPVLSAGVLAGVEGYGRDPSAIELANEPGMPHYVYMLAKQSRMFYVGVTDDIKRRTFEHKTGFHLDSYTDRFNLRQLVYYV